MINYNSVENIYEEQSVKPWQTSVSQVKSLLEHGADPNILDDDFGNNYLQPVFNDALQFSGIIRFFLVR